MLFCHFSFDPKNRFASPCTPPPPLKIISTYPYSLKRVRWEGTVALRKIGIAMIGVFGAAMEEMQVSLTLVLVFFIILLTAIKRPYGEK